MTNTALLTQNAAGGGPANYDDARSVAEGGMGALLVGLYVHSHT